MLCFNHLSIQSTLLSLIFIFKKTTLAGYQTKCKKFIARKSYKKQSCSSYLMICHTVNFIFCIFFFFEFVFSILFYLKAWENFLFLIILKFFPEFFFLDLILMCSVWWFWWCPDKSGNDLMFVFSVCVVLLWVLWWDIIDDQFVLGFPFMCLLGKPANPVGLCWVACVYFATCLRWPCVKTSQPNSFSFGLVKWNRTKLELN